MLKVQQSLTLIGTEKGASPNAGNSDFTSGTMTGGRLVTLKVEERSSTVLIKRFGTPQDIASAAVYLASDPAAWVTGKTLEIDGGLLFAARKIDGRA